MNVKPRIAGLAGILAGLGLAIELVLFMASGWSPAVFSDPAIGLAFLRDGGTQLRAAVFAGAINLVFTTLLVAGLAAWLRPTTPSRAAATLYFGLIGIAAHGLVPLGLWLGVPTFLELASRDQQIAFGAWGGFTAVIGAAGGLGYLFLGLSMAAAGWAIVTAKLLPPALGWIGLLAGAASVINVLAAKTPLDPLASAAFQPALLLSIVFRLWAGYALWRGDPALERSTAAGARSISTPTRA